MLREGCLANWRFSSCENSVLPWLTDQKPAATHPVNSVYRTTAKTTKSHTHKVMQITHQWVGVLSVACRFVHKRPIRARWGPLSPSVLSRPGIHAQHTLFSLASSAVTQSYNSRKKELCKIIFSSRSASLVKMTQISCSSKMSNLLVCEPWKRVQITEIV